MQKPAGGITAARVILAALVFLLLLSPLAYYKQCIPRAGSASSSPVLIRVATEPRSYRSACNVSDRSQPIKVAVVVRTHPGHAVALPVTLATLGLACEAAGGRTALRILLTNTDPKRYNELDFMYKAIQAGAAHLQNCPCSSIEVLQFSDAPWEDVFGYDYTQYALELLLYGCRLAGNGSCLPANASTSSLVDNMQDSFQQAPLPAYLLFTNGDNLFNVQLFKSCLPHMEQQVDVIAFSFTSHHLRDNVPNTAVRVEFVMGYIDLSSAFYRRDRLLAVGKEVANFLPQGRDTPSMFERDFFFVEGIVKNTTHGPTSTVTLSQVLLFHQR